MSTGRRAEGAPAGGVLDTGEASLLDLVDNLLNKGVVLTGDITLALAQVDLIYARLSLLLTAADRVLAGDSRRNVRTGAGSRPRRLARPRA